MATEKDRIVSGSSGKDNRSTIIICITLIIITLIIAAVVICLAIMKDKEDAEKSDNIHQLSETSESVEKVQAGYFNINMNFNWTFPKWDKPSTNANFTNDPANLHTLYYVLKLKDTEEVVYKSELIPVGYEQTGMKLQKPLDAGVYDVTCEIHMVDDSGEDVDGLSLALTLNILE